MKHALYYPKWFIEHPTDGQSKPMQSVVFITNRCNLACKHCAVFKKPGEPGFYELSFEEIIAIFEKCYAQGSRVLDIEGGEPLLWKDGDKTCRDLVRTAKAMGFVSVSIKTNGLRPIDTNADSVWVSIDGLAEIHDNIRGTGTFQKIENNIAASHFHSINCSMIINKLNYKSIDKVIKWVEKTPHLRSISFHFLAAQRELYALKLDPILREEIIDKLITLKREKAPIFNSIAGLNRMRNEDFEHYCWVSNVLQEDGTYMSECAGKKEGLCNDCGHAKYKLAQPPTKS